MKKPLAFEGFLNLISYTHLLIIKIIQYQNNLVNGLDQ